MPYTETNQQPELPWSGKGPRSRHNSYKAAVGAKTTRVLKAARYLEWLKRIGQASDHAAAEHFNWPLSSICSIRNGLVDLGKVTAVGDCLGRYGKTVTLWAAVK